MGAPQFYVAAPLGERTAGPEALTQLVDAIRRRGLEAFLLPMRNYRGRRNHPEYDRYDFEVAEHMPRSDDAYLVIPEVSPLESFRELQRTPVERTWMGWFSVNNSPDPRARFYRPGPSCCSPYPPPGDPTFDPTNSGFDEPADHDLQTPLPGRLFASTREAMRRRGPARPGNLEHIAAESVSIRYAKHVADSGVGFFAQSYYARGFCEQVFHRSAHLITDPIRIVEIAPQKRERNVVLYNKAKSWSLVPFVAELLPDVEFRSVDGLPFDRVSEELAMATVYLELGHLPGRDRMPREAAHFGTPVVLLARGAGYCWGDAPLPMTHRVAFRDGWPAQAAAALRLVLDNPEQAARQQEPYRRWVSGERDRYESAIDYWLADALSRT